MKNAHLKKCRIHTSVVFMNMIDLEMRQKLGHFHWCLLRRHNFMTINVILNDMTKVNFRIQDVLSRDGRVAINDCHQKMY